MKPMEKKEVFMTEKIDPDAMIIHNPEFALRQQKTPSSLALNIFAVSQIQLTEETKTQKTFYITRRDIQKLIGKKIKDEEMEAALKELITYPIYHKDTRLGTTLINSYERISKGLFEIEFTDKLKSLYLVQRQKLAGTYEAPKPLQYTGYSFKAKFDLKLKYSKRMFEYLSNFKNMTHHRVKIIDLKKYMGVYDMETEVDKYSRWADFKRKILEPSLTEINNATTLKVSYSPYKLSSRFYEGITFAFKKEEKEKSQLAFDFESSFDQKHLEQLIKQYQLRADQAKKFLQKNDFNTEKDKLYKFYLEHRDKNNIGRIKNLGGYIAKIYGLN